MHIHCIFCVAILIFIFGFSYLIYQHFFLNRPGQHYRLPTDIKPLSYKLKIITNLDDANNLTYEGEVKIKIYITEPTMNITLHGTDNYIIDKQAARLSQFKEMEGSSMPQLRRWPPICCDNCKFVA